MSPAVALIAGLVVALLIAAISIAWIWKAQRARLETREGRMVVPDRPGLGVTFSDQARAWTTDTVEFGTR